MNKIIIFIIVAVILFTVFQKKTTEGYQSKRTDIAHYMKVPTFEPRWMHHVWPYYSPARYATGYSMYYPNYSLYPYVYRPWP